MCSSDRNDMMERYSDPTGAAIQHIHMHSIIAMPIPRLRGIESLFQSRETERSYTTDIHASSIDVVEVTSVVRQVLIGTRSLVVNGEVDRE